MNSKVFRVRTGKGTLSGETFTDIVDTVERRPIARSGYYLVRYKGKKYVLHGGLRTEYHIYLDSPVKG